MTENDKPNHCDSDAKPWAETSSITKVDAAKRMFDTSVEMFFGNSDNVSTYLLAASSEQILEDLLNAKGSGGIIRNTYLIKEGKHKEYFRAIKRNENFFKHADRDPHESLEFNSAATPLMLMAACDLLPRFTETFHAHTIVFRLWFMAAYPDMLIDRGQELSTLLTPVAPADDFELYRIMLKEPTASLLVAQNNWKVPEIPDGPYDIFMGG